MENLSNHVDAGRQLAIAQTALTQLEHTLEQMGREQETEGSIKWIECAVELCNEIRKSMTALLKAEHEGADEVAVNAIYPARPFWYNEIFPTRPKEVPTYWFSANYARALVACYLYLTPAQPDSPDYQVVATGITVQDADRWLEDGSYSRKFDVERNHDLRVNLFRQIQELQQK